MAKVEQENKQTHASSILDDFEKKNLSEYVFGQPQKRGLFSLFKSQSNKPLETLDQYSEAPKNNNL